MIRKSIAFFGSVQGVGFRFRALHAAEMYRCTGWVRNEYDGSVLMEIQGEDNAIDQVLMAIERGTYVSIEDMRVKNIPVVPQERGFQAL